MSIESPLGQNASYPDRYDPGLLFPVSRDDARRSVGITGSLPFAGSDWWNAYELSWLEPGGKPRVAVGEFEVPATSPNIIESKSLKLYLNSLNQCRYDSPEAVAELLIRDLSHAAGAPVGVRLCGAADWRPIQALPGMCIDQLELSVEDYRPDPGLLKSGPREARETLHSHLLKTNCPVTGQPDWGSVVISYAGPRVHHSALLRYLVSFRSHDGFHENCIEHIFMDLLRECAPRELSVQGLYTRRGGIDINPFRSNLDNATAEVRRAWRQ
ncbi:MAG: NADPH-dependent 7-cyano-7-deazaguanine reductase QueF [Xanthomonadales bacterium]|nr:NADPH-dependent 7-cyano-7-deazaguanine reductase QueF [Xanthomonadales bacterium]